MAKKNNLKSWKDISNYKKHIDITFEGDKLFYFEEPTDETIGQLYELMKDYNIQDFDNNAQVISFILKNTIKDIDFGDMTDDEIFNQINNMSDEIVLQINEALDKLVINKLKLRLNNIKRMISQLDELNVNKEEQVQLS